MRLLVLHSVATKRLLPVVMAILRVWWKHIYATVLDENYLVGRTLVNSNLRLNERVKSTPVS